MFMYARARARARVCVCVCVCVCVHGRQPGTSAPMHYHRTAMNVLIQGEKQWRVFPPRDAFYSTIHEREVRIDGVCACVCACVC